MNSADRTVELLEQFIESKENLADMLTSKGEEASFDEPFNDLVQKAGDYIPKSFIFTDEFGKEIPGMLVDQETVFTATPNDVREGKVFASELGVKTGEKYIPSYNTSEGYTLIPNGKAFSIKNLPVKSGYDFTKLQAIICTYAGSVAKSVSAQKVAIDEKVYATKSTSVIATITRDHTNKAIDFGITNNSGSLCLLRYFTYKEM